MSLHSSQNGPTRGERLLPSLVDELARSDPDRILYSISKTSDPADGFRDIDIRTFARAVNRCAWYIEKHLGGPGKDFPTLTYLGPQDLVYGILVFACIKTGYKLLLNSPRNSLEAHLRLLDQTECHTFLRPQEFALPVIKQILSKRKMRVVDIPTVQYWLEEESVDHYPYEKTFEEAKHEPFVVLHTSGSTGWPKPIVQNHGTHSPLDAYEDLPSMGYKPVFPIMLTGMRMYLSFPLFHCAGVVTLLVAPIYSNFTVVLASFPPSTDIVNSVHVNGNVQVSTVPTAVLIELCKVPEFLDNLSKLKLVIYGGGPCPQAVGDLASTKTHITSALGSTEAGVVPNHISDPGDWAYLSFSPALGSEYRPYTSDLYEHFIVRNAKFERFQGIFNTFPSLQEWATKDLYSQHPTKENTWLYRGRTDDIIVFSTGEKLNPIAMEDTINGNPCVSAALIAGHGYFQTSLLVEAVNPPSTESEMKDVLDDIWPSVEIANRDSPSHARIFRDMVLFVSPDKPMLRAGKGTVQRKSTLELYKPQIEALYRASETFKGIYSSTGQIETSHDAIASILRSSTTIDLHLAQPDADLFELGLDSLQAIYLAKKLNNVLASNGRPQSIEPRDVYKNSTIRRLSKFVVAKIQGDKTTLQVKTDEENMQAIYNELVAFLPVSVRKMEPKPKGEVFILTGSTGSLGNYILESLVQNSSVTTVYCLNRGPNSASRQKSSREAKGLRSSLGKVELLDADFSKPYFGLSITKYRELLVKVTGIIHNGWKVDFNLDVSSFATHMSSVRRFVDFSAHSRHGAHIFFISSIGAISNISSDDGTNIPEQVFNDWRISQSAGYGQSKLISECLLDVSAREVDIPATLFRVGQIAGPTTQLGSWSKQEWLPSLIASSLFLGKLPDSLGQMDNVDWIPVNLLGDIIVDIALKDAIKYAAGGDIQGQGASVYHLVNPQTTAWSELLPVISKHLSASTGKPIEAVSLVTWIDALRQSTRRDEDVGKNPAAKIIDSYESFIANKDKSAKLEVKRSVQESQMLADIGPVKTTWMENWLRQWSYC